MGSAMCARMRLGSIIPILLRLVEVEVHVKQTASVYYVNFIMELVAMLMTKYVVLPVKAVVSFIYCIDAFLIFN